MKYELVKLKWFSGGRETASPFSHPQLLTTFMLLIVIKWFLFQARPALRWPLYSPSVTLSTFGRWEYGRFLYTCSMIFSFTCEMVSQFSTLTDVTSGPSSCTSTCRVWQMHTQTSHWAHMQIVCVHVYTYSHSERHAQISKHCHSTLPPTYAYPHILTGWCCYGNWDSIDTHTLQWHLKTVTLAS